MHKKNVLVTGSSRGIGRACALAFAEAGYHVFINCRNSTDRLISLEKEILDADGSCTKVPDDVGNPDTVRSIFSTISAACGGLDVLVNNAGIPHFGLLSDMTDAEWKNLIDTNLSSCFYTCREVIPGMVSAKSGRIINIGSVWGKLGASCEAAYSAAKAGISGLTMALSKELGPSGITVNCVLPGVIETDMNSNLSEDALKELAENTPLMRLGTPDDVAETVLFLASEKASFITGELIGVGGGFPF